MLSLYLCHFYMWRGKDTALQACSHAKGPSKLQCYQGKECVLSRLIRLREKYGVNRVVLSGLGRFEAFLGKGTNFCFALVMLF